MADLRRALAAAVVALIATTVSAQQTSGTVTTAVRPTPTVAKGFAVQQVAGSLQTPRGIIFDSQDRLIAVQKNVGVVVLTFQNQNGNTTVKEKRNIITDDTLNHGIELSPDGKTLYASSTEYVYSYDYDPMTGMTMSEPTILVGNMTTEDHTTRTLLLSKKDPGMLIVTRGSTSNVDPLAEDLSTGHSQIKAFSLKNMTGPYNFNTDGMLLGWGLRNDVGIAEHPVTGGLYSVENSVDQMMRDGKDIHATNPAEELNFLGMMVNNTSPNQGSNFGYPECYTAWDPSAVPNSPGLKVGMQFAIGDPDPATNDTFCQNDRTAPRLGFEAHMAPLDIKFDTAGTTAWVTFHGSWDRAPLDPSGYKVSAIAFQNGEPVAPSTSNTGYVDIVANMDHTKCPDQCFRPVGLAFDSRGRLFFSSDATGDIYMITSTATMSSTNGTSGSNSTSSNGSVQTATIPTSSTPLGTSTPANAATTTLPVGTYLQCSWFLLLALAGFWLY